MGIDVQETLTAQGLDASDLEQNRAGKVSEKQIARQLDVRRGGGTSVWIMALSALVACGGVGAWRIVQHGDVGIAVFMGILGLVMAALPLGIYYAFRFPDPVKVGAGTVTCLENAEVGVFLPSSTRGVYNISLNGKRYSGFASALSRAHLGTRVNAYVVPEYRIVVALEPVE
ncbi:MAG: hypothetical protein QM758_04325 [Armatimonas sp.]